MPPAGMTENYFYPYIRKEKKKGNYTCLEI